MASGLLSAPRFGWGLLARSVPARSPLFNVLSRIEVWARRITGVICIVVGGYYCLTYIFEVFV